MHSLLKFFAAFETHEDDRQESFDVFRKTKFQNRSVHCSDMSQV